MNCRRLPLRLVETNLRFDLGQLNVNSLPSSSSNTTTCKNEKATRTMGFSPTQTSLPMDNQVRRQRHQGQYISRISPAFPIAPPSPCSSNRPLKAIYEQIPRPMYTQDQSIDSSIMRERSRSAQRTGMQALESNISEEKMAVLFGRQCMMRCAVMVMDDVTACYDSELHGWMHEA